MRIQKTVSIDASTWEFLHKLAKAYGVPKSRVIDMAVLDYHAHFENGDLPPPQRRIQVFGEEE